MPDWDKILEDHIFEIPSDILMMLTPGEIARVDQYLAHAKDIGGRALRQGKDPEDVVELIIDDLESMANIVEAATRRTLNPEPPKPPLLDLDADFEKGEDDCDGEADDLPNGGMPW